MTAKSKRILVIYYNYDPPGKMRLAIQHHLRGLEQGATPHRIVYHNAYTAPYWELDEQLESPPPAVRQTKFDAVILHNSFLCLRWTGWHFYKLKRRFDWIRQIDVPKIAIPQDEGDHAGLLDEWLLEWGVQAVLTVHHHGGADSPLYPRLRHRARFYRCYPGYIDEQSARVILPKLLPPRSRPFDVVYRATHLPYWFGSAGQRKHVVAEKVAACAKEMGLRSDISTSEADAILGNDWMDFMMSGRATIGCEGGSSVLDWRGEIRAQIQAMLDADPGLSFETISACMPKGWDNYRFLTITPRHFEAVITKTCQVLVEGDYRGVLEPDRHYIPIKPDFSNLDQALKKLCDKDLVHDIVERAYTDICLNNRYTYSAFAELIDQALEDFDQAATSDGVEEMSNERQAWLALEQQLIAEKHNGLLLQAKNQEAMVRLSRLEADLQVARNHELQRQEELSKAQARLQSVQEQLSLAQDSLQATQARLDHAKSLLERPFVAFAYAARLHNKKLAVLISLFLTLLSALIVAFCA